MTPAISLELERQPHDAGAQVLPTLTLGWLTLLDTATADVIGAAAEAGFRSVSIRITGRKLGDPYEPIVGNPAKIAKLRRQLDDCGLRLSNTSVYHLSPAVTLESLLPAIDATVELGAPIIVANCMDPDHERWIAFMQRYCEAARAAGITLALEFMRFSEAKTLEVANRLVERIGAPNMGLLIDPLHLSRAREHPADIRRIDPARIVFAQLCDAVGKIPSDDGLAHEARTGRRFPGDGELPLYEFLDALPDGIEVECETPWMALADRPAVEQARAAMTATHGFLDGYCAARHKPAWR
jgi:sugar phosphate isomerase/epimerase